MANKFYIKEFETLPQIPGGVAQIWAEPGHEQTPLDVSGAHQESAAFGVNTKFIVITSDIDCSYLVSDVGTAATNSNLPLWSKNYLAVAVEPGQFISAVPWS